MFKIFDKHYLIHDFYKFFKIDSPRPVCINLGMVMLQLKASKPPAHLSDYFIQLFFCEVLIDLV